MTDGIPAHYLRNFYRDAYELVRVRICPRRRHRRLLVFGASRASGSILCAAPSTRTSTWTFTCTITATSMRCDITSPRGLTTAISRNKRELKEAISTGFPVLVGEWSGCGDLCQLDRLRPRAAMPTSACSIANQLAIVCAGCRLVLPNVEDREAHCSMGRPRGARHARARHD